MPAPVSCLVDRAFFAGWILTLGKGLESPLTQVVNIMLYLLTVCNKMQSGTEICR